MKKVILFLFLVLCHTVKGQDKPPRLIIRGDDMGYTHSGNVALMKCFKDGFQTSIEVIVPSPWFTEAAKMLKENPAADVGIHLALTSEWENIKWRPLTDCPSLRDSKGYFYPMVNPNPNYPGQAILENQWKIEDVEKELRAQIELAVRMIPQVSHLSSHMGCTNISPEVKALERKLATEYHLDIDLGDYHVEWKSYNGPSKTSEEKINSFVKMLSTLEKGKTYLFLDHPGLDNEELRAVYHIGYENVAVDRQGVTDLFTSKVVREAIRKNGIQLIGYKDLVK